MIKWLKKLFEDPYPIKESTSYPFIYPKNPKYNGNYCAGPDGINIYDYLDDNGEIDWKSIDEAHILVDEWRFRKWMRENPGI